MSSAECIGCDAVVEVSARWPANVLPQGGHFIVAAPPHPKPEADELGVDPSHHSYIGTHCAGLPWHYHFPKR